MAKKEKLYSLDENGVLTIASGVTVITKQDVAQFTARDIKEVVIPDGVLEIEYGVFNYTSIKSVEIPDSVTRMAGAFDCSAIENVKLPKGLKYVGGFNCTNLKSIEIPDGVEKIGSFKECKKIESVKLPAGLKEIYPNTFEGCFGLKSMELPEGLENIGKEAFKNCTSLESVVIPKSVQLLADKSYNYHRSVFEGCSSLKNVVIEDGVEEMEGTFKNCISLESIVIPKSVKKIKGDFEGCTALKNVTLQEGLEEILGNTFEGCSALESIVIPKSVKKIDLNSFSGTSIKELTIPAGSELEVLRCVMDADIKTEDDRYTFDGTKLIDNQKKEVLYVKSSVKNVKIEDGLSLAPYILDGLSSMETLELGKEAVKDEVKLDGCASLKRIRAPKSVKIYGLPKDVVLDEIDRYDDGTGTDNTESDFIMLGIKEQVIESKFYNASRPMKVERIVCTDGLTALTIRYGLYYSELKEVVLPASVKDFVFDLVYVLDDSPERPNFDVKVEGGDLEFDGTMLINKKTGKLCYSKDAENIVIPDGVKEIGSYVFTKCLSLKSVVIPDGVEEIGYEAFKGCQNLESVVLPKSVKTIGGSAFKGCKSLKSIELNDGLENIGIDAFAGCMALKEVRIPASVKSIDWILNLDADLIVECTGYRFENGTLIDEGKSEIIYIKESLKDLVVPKDVKKIEYAHCHPKFESATLLNPNVKCDEFPLVDDGVIYVACTPAAMAKLKEKNRHWGWTNGVMKVMKK